MITEIKNLEDYHRARMEWSNIFEFAVEDFTPWQKQRMAFLEEIMDAWAYDNAQEIWPTRIKQRKLYE